jgi:hypothetical protein
MMAHRKLGAAASRGPSNYYCYGLETDDRSDGDAQIVVRAVVEIDLIADVEPQSDYSPMRFDAAPRIHRGVPVRPAKGGNRTGECVKRRRSRVKAEVHEAALNRQEQTDRSVTRLNRRPKQAIQSAKPRPLRSKAATCTSRTCETLCEYLIKVVAHFCFESEVTIRINGDSSAEACKACVTGFSQPQVIHKSSHLAVVLS